MFESCGVPDPEPTYDYQTEILEVNVTPDTVVVGDTVLFHCVIEDSLDPSFKFNWISIPEEDLIPVNGKVNGPKVKWQAEPYAGSPGENVRVRFTVIVDNGDESKDQPTETFYFYIQH
ncbi:hypothetical protein [Gracilimonas mengyeensis]|uniref:Ig-like domain-containing protein n=1 Tax=Gracilimonas mengyeensis TaxID=1302730 RepID=A0A521FDC1_9BACT|nr:hypothetical protein [Gracilimonas mengyeensis]SMO94182.1 hypothetical protein SAMN06265219_11763 [Gracilimonas mengyeensis]